MTRPIKLKEAYDVLKQHLATLPNRPPTVWENQEQDPAKWPPGLIMLVQATMLDAWRRTHDNGHLITGLLQITVLARENTNTSEGEKLADRLSDHFPSGLRLGKVEITKAAKVGPAYNNPPYWRLPIAVNWRYLT